MTRNLDLNLIHGKDKSDERINFLRIMEWARQIQVAPTDSDEATTTFQFPIEWKDEGSIIAALGLATTINFVGAGVTATYSGGVVTVTIPTVESHYCMYGASASAGQTSLTMSMDGGDLSSTSPGVPVPTAMTFNKYAVSFISDNVPAGAWTLNFYKRADGETSFTLAATATVDTS